MRSKYFNYYYYYYYYYYYCYSENVVIRQSSSKCRCLSVRTVRDRQVTSENTVNSQLADTSIRRTPGVGFCCFLVILL